MNERWLKLIGLRVIVFKKADGRFFRYQGILNSVDDIGIWIDERKNGMMFISHADISEVMEAKADG